MANADDTTPMSAPLPALALLAIFAIALLIGLLAAEMIYLANPETVLPPVSTDSIEGRAGAPPPASTPPQ